MDDQMRKLFWDRPLVGRDCEVCHISPGGGVNSWGFNHDSAIIPFCLPCHYNKARDKHTPSTKYNFDNLGDCYNCHRNYRKSTGRNWDD